MNVVSRERIHELETELAEVHRAFTELTNELEDQIEAHRLTTEKLRKSEGRMRAISENAVELTFVVNRDGCITYLSPSVCDLTKYADARLVGAPLWTFIESDDVPLVEEAVTRAFETPNRPIKISDFRLQCRDLRWVYLEGSAIGMPDVPGVEGIVVNCHDVTDRKKYEETILRQANYDSLTALPNRILLRDRLDSAFERARRSRSKVALMFIDLDGFKKINDSLGHSVGDRLLQETASRLSACVRKVDTVARLGGDEFTVVLSELDKDHHAELVARKILKSLSLPFDVGNSRVFISGSIGITVFPSDSEDYEELMKNADTAMYEAKRAGRNVYRFFTRQMNIQADETIRLETDLRYALAKDQLYLKYQPIVELATGRVSAVEALLRWEHDKLGTISPDRFIPLAEETGLIVRIGEHVIETVGRQMNAWREAGLPSIRVAVNVSPRQLRETGFVDVVSNMLTQWHLDAASVAVEITESIFIESSNEQALMALRDLRKLGVMVSLDDFGTGYSSLSYLKRFPVDILKIDRAFVKNISREAADETLVQAAITMAHGLGIKVVAEGVEARDQIKVLRSRNCDYAQGYHFSKPISADEIDHYVRSNRREATARAMVDGRPAPATADAR